MTEVEKILKDAGVEIDGPNPWDIKVNYQKTTKEKLFSRIIRDGTLGVGESYMDNWWNSDDLEETYFRILRNARFQNLFSFRNLIYFLKSRLMNFQSKDRSFQVGEQHYDLGNDLYTSMLGKTMSYTNAYWNNADNLDDAQIAKLDLICKKLNLKKGQKILDVGCGWGNFMKYAAENYGVSCIGLSVSKEQIKLGQERCKDLPIEFVFTDYRDYNPGYKFDHIVSIEMIEAVGPKNYAIYFAKLSSLLKEEGLFLLQVIGNSKTNSAVEPWIDKYIFPNGHLPSLKQIVEAIEKPWYQENVFEIEDLHSLGIDYSKTLNAWFENFDKNYELLRTSNPKYNQRFYRMWKYYLLTCGASERARAIFSWQIVFSKKGVLGGYKSVR